ncbi:MAG: hypothetical protein ACOY0T_14845 [Myxococcota bacterium]
MSVGAIETQAAFGRKHRALSVPAALIVVLPLAWPVLVAAWHASHVMFGRDQGIYQFAAWAVSKGARDYLDIRDINGPMTHAVHQLLLALGGEDEQRFRALDIVITFASFGFTGACLPGFYRAGQASQSSGPSLGQRLAWSAVGCVVLGAQYLSFTYWDIGQRESFCNWMFLPSIGLMLLVQGNASVKRVLAQRALLVLAGVLSLLPWFIKPTYAFCSLLQIAALLLAPAPEGRLRGVLAFAAGLAAGLALELAWLLRFSDVGAMLRAYVWEAPRMYGPIWHIGPGALLLRTGFPNWSGYALLVAVLLAGMTQRGWLPRRALVLAALPVLAVFHVLVQGKGFGYHYHLLTASTYLALMAAVCVLAERSATSRFGFRVPLASALALTGIVAWRLTSVPYLDPRYRIFEGNSFDRPRLELSRHYRYMRYNPWDLGRAASYVAKATLPGAKIFLYGTNPYLLFLAKRDSATRDLYVHQLNVDAAIDGRSASAVAYEPGERLSPARERELRAIRDRNARVMFEDLKRAPPALAVFTDHEAFMSETDSWLDFKQRNPEAAVWLSERYREVVRFGTTRIWERIP